MSKPYSLKSRFSVAILGLLAAAACLGVPRPAHAGSWVVQELVYNENSQSQTCAYGNRQRSDNLGYLFDDYVTNVHGVSGYTANVYKPGHRVYDTLYAHSTRHKATTGPTGPENTGQIATVPIQGCYLNWGSGDEDPANPYNSNSHDAKAKGSWSVTPILVWQADPNDPKDVPPATSYFLETASITGNERYLAGQHGLPTDRSGFIQFTDMKCPFVDPKATFKQQNIQVGLSTDYKLAGTNIYLLQNPNRQRVIACPTRTFFGHISLSATAFQKEYIGYTGWAEFYYHYNITPLLLSLKATPVGPYSVTKDEPFNKEYNAGSRWAMNLTDDDGTFTLPSSDPNAPPASRNKAIHAQAVINGESSFTAVAKRADGTDIFPDQKLVWKATDTPYIPAPLFFSVDSQPEILLYKWKLNLQDKLATGFLNSMGPSITPAEVSAWLHGHALPEESGAIMSPQLRDDFFRHLELAWRGSHPPAEQQVDSSTLTKDFTWKLGDADNYQRFNGVTSTVRAYVTGQNADDPLIPLGKIKINWTRPKKSIWRVTIYPVTWHVRQGESFIDLFRSAFSSNEALTAQMEIWGTERLGQVALALVGGGGVAAEGGAIEGSVAPTVFEVTAAGDASGSEVLEQGLNRASDGAVEGAAEEAAIPDGSEATVRGKAEQIGDVPEGQAGEPPVEEEVTVTKGGGCFVAGTPILMGDGTLQPIESLHAGDSVLSKDARTGEISSKKVLRVTTRVHVATLLIAFSNGEKVETTANHPFFVEGKGFISAKDLGIGSSIVTRAGPSVIISEITPTHNLHTVYNCTVEDFHTYFVGKSAFWVHNVDCEINITESGYQHVLDRHVEGGFDLDRSSGIFDRGVDIKSLIKLAENERPQLQANGRYWRTIEADTFVGVDRTRLLTKKVTVITEENGDLVSAWPGEHYTF